MKRSALIKCQSFEVGNVLRDRSLYYIQPDFVFIVESYPCYWINPYNVVVYFLAMQPRALASVKYEKKYEKMQ